MRFLALFTVCIFFVMPLNSWAKVDRDMLSLEELLEEEKQKNEVVPEKVKPLVEEVVLPKAEVLPVALEKDAEKQGAVTSPTKKTVVAKKKAVENTAPDEMTLRLIAGAAGLFAILIILFLSRKKVKARSSEVIQKQSDEEALEIQPCSKNKKVKAVAKKEEPKVKAPVKVNLPGKMDTGSSKVKVNLPSKSTKNVEAPTEDELVEDTTKKKGMTIAKTNKVNRPPVASSSATD